MAVDAVAQETPRFRLMLAGRWSWLPGNVTLLVGGLIVGGIIGLSLLAPWISPYDPVKPDYGVALLPPGPGHLFGTDNFGRDIFTRILFGGIRLVARQHARAARWLFRWPGRHPGDEAGRYGRGLPLPGPADRD